MAYEVFISHSKQDKAVAEAVCAMLEAERIRCWIAPRDIEPGMDWAGAIMGALESCRVMVLVFSSSSNTSPQVKREVEQAFNNGLIVVPFRIEDVQPTPSLRYYIGSVHWLDALTLPMGQHIAKLVPSIKAIVNAGGSAAPAPQVDVAEEKRLAEEKRAADEKRSAEEQRQQQYSAAVAAGEAAFKKQDFEAAAREARNALGLIPDGAEALALTERLLPTLEVRSLVDGRDVPGAVIGFSGKASEHRTPITFKFEVGKTYELSVSLPADNGLVYESALKTFVADWRGPQVWAASLAAAKPEPPKLRVPPGCRAAEGADAEPYSKSGWAQEIVHEATGMAFRFIPAGAFTMGSPEEELGRSDDEVQHRVTLTRGFYLGKYPVTQAQWERVMGANPSAFKGADLPVEKVSWNDCQAFLKKLGAGARLPTEAEWEYACRAGTTSALNSGKALTSAKFRCPNLEEVAWYRANSDLKTHVVGQKRPNAWGLYDMHGNVWEWCSDWYGVYPEGAATDPQGAHDGLCRVVRSGCWSISAYNCRSAYRYDYTPDYAGDYIGFRAVLPLGQQ